MVGTRESEFDVVVAGAGLAGLVCALTVAETGASVAVLEKGSEAGGSSAQSGGGLVFAGTDLQVKAGVHDSWQALREDLIQASQGRAQPELIDAYVANQLGTYQWLCSQGLQFSLASSASGVARAHLTGRGIAVRHLYERLRADDRICFLPNTSARRLVRSTDDRVHGVEVSTEHSHRTLGARAGVVLATGGFARSEDLLRRFAPQWVTSVKMGGPHNTGDGITLARALGADLVDMPYVAASFGASIAHYPDLTLDPDENPILLYPNYLGGIIINLDGVRFADETLNYKVLSRLCADQREGAAVQIFDADVFARSDPRAMPRDIQSAYDAGLVVKADSVRELATALNLDPDVLHDTVDRYNGFALNGKDADFGRPMTPGADAGRGQIATSPFYGFPTRPGLTSTYAGLAVDAQMRVINVHGDPITGLYAAGETVGGFHGAGYYSGTALGKAAIFGRIAGTRVMTDRGRVSEPEHPKSG